MLQTPRCYRMGHKMPMCYLSLKNELIQICRLIYSLFGQMNRLTFQIPLCCRLTTTPQPVCFLSTPPTLLSSPTPLLLREKEAPTSYWICLRKTTGISHLHLPVSVTSRLTYWGLGGVAVFFPNASVTKGEGGTNFLLDLFEENNRDIPTPFTG